MQDVFTLKAQHWLDKLTDEEFFQLCQANKDLRIERNKNLEIIITSPTGSKAGILSGELFRQLANWNQTTRSGKAFDSSTGFTLPDQSVLSPNASWIPNAAWTALNEADQNRFAPICPTFVIELKSPSDNLDYLKKKMEIWITNGVQLAWLINPEDETIDIYRPAESTETRHGFNQTLSGEQVLLNFELDLSLLK